MIDPGLLQSYMFDIEWLKTLLRSSANGSSSSYNSGFDASDPFEEILARAMGKMDPTQLAQLQESGLLPSGTDPKLQMFDAFWNKTLMNPGVVRSGALTQSDLDRLFPEMVKMSSLLGSLQT